MLQIEWKGRRARIAMRDVHHRDDRPPAQRFPCPTVLEQHIGVRRLSAVPAFSHISQVGDKSGSTIDLAKDRFHDRRRTGHARRIVIEHGGILVVAVRVVHARVRIQLGDSISQRSAD